MWKLLTFILNSLIFMLIGIQMSDVIEKLSRYTIGELFMLGTVISIVAVGVRFVWVYAVAAVPGGWVPSNRPDESKSMEPKPQEPKPNARELFIVSWCGMRGIVSIAAALSLPVLLPDGSAFPQRELIIFLTFFVIAVTLVVQGLSLPPLIRGLKVGSDWSLHGEQQRVRSAMSRAALSVLDERMRGEGIPASTVDTLRSELLDRINIAAPDGAEHTPRSDLIARLRHEAIQAERRELIRLWRANEISDEVMHHLEELLDYQEAHL